MTSFVIAPGERRDVLVDFTGAPAGTTVRLLNDANAPFPDGDPVIAWPQRPDHAVHGDGAPGSGFHPSTTTASNPEPDPDRCIPDIDQLRRWKGT